MSKFPIDITTKLSLGFNCIIDFVEIQNTISPINFQQTKKRHRKFGFVNKYYNKHTKKKENSFKL
jgi:hypothetical protein